MLRAFSIRILGNFENHWHIGQSVDLHKHSYRHSISILRVLISREHCPKPKLIDRSACTRALLPVHKLTRHRNHGFGRMEFGFGLLNLPQWQHFTTCDSPVTLHSHRKPAAGGDSWGKIFAKIRPFDGWEFGMMFDQFLIFPSVWR